MTKTRHIALIASFFIFAGIMHFVIPAAYDTIMPPWVPSPMTMVYVSGILEIAGGIGALFSSLRRAAGVGLIILLIAVFPANVQMLFNAITRGASPLAQGFVWLRLSLQPLMIYWVYRVLIRRPSPPAP